ncbi:MAG TPA: DUF4262 domain-containing protein [Bryobacteraceae bacterium]|nr:DUF4262 domain-containing protein [Bryobacteraceae bacterium]
MTGRAKREAAFDEIRRNIAEYGFHTYVVTGSGKPHYGYTIGLTESLGTELILAGAYFYRLNEVSSVIRGVADELRSPLHRDTQRLRESPWGNFSLQKVDISWAKELMLGFFDYYGVNAIEARQIVPDESHWTVDIPDLSKPMGSNAAPGWQWLSQDWAYPIPKESVALTNIDALRGERITEVMRWEKDEWEIFAGAGPEITEAERRVVPLGILLAADPSLVPAVDLSIGSGFWRDAEPKSEWHAWGKPA